MNRAVSEQTEIFFRQMPAEEFKQMALPKILEVIELGRFFVHHMDDSGRQVNVEILICDREVILRDKDDPAHKIVRIVGANAAWLTFTLLMHLEDRRTSALWACSFHNSPRVRARVNGINEEISRIVAKEFPTLGLKIAAGKTASMHTVGDEEMAISDYTLFWNRSAARLVGAPFNSLNSCNNAHQAFTDGDISDALCFIGEAITTCAQFFLPYALLLDCYARSPDDVYAFLAQGHNRQQLMAGTLKLEHWLLTIRNGFTFAHIPTFENTITTHCLAEIDARLAKIRRIKKILGGDATDATTHIPPLDRNPLNPFLDAMRSKSDKNSDLLTDLVEHPDFRSLQEGCLSAIRADRRYVTWELQHRRESRLPTVTKDHLFTGLLDVGEEAGYWFPEPSDDDMWREITIKKWKNAVFKSLLASEGNNELISLDGSPHLEGRIAESDSNASDDCEEDAL